MVRPFAVAGSHILTQASAQNSAHNLASNYIEFYGQVQYASQNAAKFGGRVFRSKSAFCGKVRNGNLCTSFRLGCLDFFF